MTRVAVVGASGFIGSQIVRALQSRGAEVVSVRAPRTATSQRTVDGVVSQARSLAGSALGCQLRAELQACDVVVNAAGVADAVGSGDELFGANAVLPALVCEVAPEGSRVIQISSASVQGRRKRLDESESVAPFSPYSRSKALGELSSRTIRPNVVVYRPGSVQGAGRSVTMALLRVADSRFASVASPGTDPTPQALVQNVADAVAFLALWQGALPTTLMHPSEGLSTSDLLEAMGGDRPKEIPRIIARALVCAAAAGGGISPRLAGLARRLEMLWFGQAQTSAWLSSYWTAPLGLEHWRKLR